MPSTWLGSARTTPRVAGLAEPTEEYVDSQLPKVMSAAANTGRTSSNALRGSSRLTMTSPTAVSVSGAATSYLP